MINRLFETILIVAGPITAWFVADGTIKFELFQSMVALILITLVMCLLAFWPFRWK